MRWTALVLALIPCLGLLRGRTELPTDLEPSFRMACWKGDLNQVKAFLALGAPLEEGDSEGRTPLILAVHNSLEIVQFLLAHGARVNATSLNGSTAFTFACERGVLPDAKILLAAGADINHVTKSGQTALMLAANEGHDDIVSFLIGQHVDVNFGVEKSPAIFEAICQDHVSTTKLLLAAGAQLKHRSEGPPLDPDHDPQPAVSLAATAGDLGLVDLLLAHGADINERDRYGITALLATAFTKDRAAVIGGLLDRGADPNISEDDDGTTPLMGVMGNQDVPTLRLLLQHGANLEAQDHDGRTAMIRAAMIRATEQVEQIRELIRQKANINVVDHKGETALTYAGDRGGKETVALLKEAGATRTDLHIIPKQEASPPLSQTQRWALAVGAIYAQYNGDSHACLAEDNNSSSSQNMLEDSWGIQNRAQLLAEIHRLDRGPEPRRIAQEETAAILAAPGSLVAIERLIDVGYLDLAWQGKMYRAWDLCRETNLVRAGVDAGFLPEKDAWPILMNIARRTQATFHSWREMDENFLDSRKIWDGRMDPDFVLCSDLLLNPRDPNSPWNQLDWKTDLGAETK